jgi:sugar lactone lactonase YvrE
MLQIGNNRWWSIGTVTILSVISGLTAPFRVASFSKDGTLSWSDAIVPGVCTIESGSTPFGPWTPECNAFATNAGSSIKVQTTKSSGFYRIRSTDVSGTDEGFTNFVSSYGLLQTVAGTGVGQMDGVSYWQPWYEDGQAQWAALSRPHFAMADRAGNIYIADKGSHSILRVDSDGFIHTHAGTHTGGFNGDGPAPATSLNLNLPNGEWVRADGTVYVLDTDNGRVRRVDTNGIMTTLFMATSDGSALSGGRGLWVSEDESLAYFCASTKLKKWTPLGGVKTLASNFSELGDLIVEPGGAVIVCDRGANYVHRMTPAGSSSIIAGNGKTTGGGDGWPALQTGLYGVRGVWPVPTGGYLLLTHDGCQLWYLDTKGVVRLLLNGAGGRTHFGDGAFFYTPWPTISEGRSVSMGYDGSILVCESDYGFVRRIQFLPSAR